MNKPLFIVLEGIDGNGKTTQAVLLKKWLEKKGKKVLLTSEPSDSKYGKKIEELVRGTKKINKKIWIELFTKDRIEHEKEIKKALKSGLTVICDRFFYSTLAYQLEKKEWEDYARNFLKPDIVFILDVPVEVAMERIKKRCKEKKEKKRYFEKAAFLEKVRKNFLQIPKILNHNIKIIEGTRKPREIFKDIKKEIEPFL